MLAISPLTLKNNSANHTSNTHTHTHTHELHVEKRYKDMYV